MSWIVANWRLKLLSLMLALGLLAAVAFASNPVGTKTVAAKVFYNNQPADLALLNPPLTINVTVLGLANAVTTVGAANVGVDVDLTKLKKGKATVQVTPRVNVQGVSVQNEKASIELVADDLKPAQLDVDIRYTQVQTGWAVTKAEARCGNAPPPCKVLVTGPASVLDGLKAFAKVDTGINTDDIRVPSVEVQFEQKGRPIDLAKQVTVPQISIDPKIVEVHIEAKKGTQSRQVVLIDAPPVRPPPAGFRVTRITIDPISILIIGPADRIQIDSITLPAVDLGDRGAGDWPFNVAIPLPDGVTGSANRARIVYTIQQNPNAAQPTASPTH